MARHGEPMDIDGMESDFDNKENTFHHSNVLPCTEKGYEELDVSELNMKLRYSITPASSPMSKSYTGCLDKRNLDIDDTLHLINENGNLTHSLNSTINKNDSVIKSLKALPLQLLPSEQFLDSNGNNSVLRQLDSTINPESSNVTVTISGTNDIDENLSLPSSSSSVIHTPELITPTKDKDSSKTDGGSPIMRGLKTVLNMFRSSQSPIPAVDGDEIKQELLPAENLSINDDNNQISQQATASTPVATHRSKDGSTSKRNSPYKESLVFSDDLEKELQWNNETTIIFSQEKIPIHKLFFQQAKPYETKYADTPLDMLQKELAVNLNSTMEYMDISFNGSNVREKIVAKVKTDVMTSSQQNIGTESDSEFLDCETTFTKNESQLLEEPENISNIQKIDELKKTNVTEDAPRINATEDTSSIIVTLTSNTLQQTLEVNTSINSNNTMADASDIMKRIPERQKEGNNEVHNVVLQESVALMKPKEIQVINETKEDEKNIVEHISTAENILEIPLQVVSQKKDLETEIDNVDTEQSLVIMPAECEIESQVVNQNIDINPFGLHLAFEPKMETLQDNKAANITIEEVKDLNPSSNDNIKLNVTSENYSQDGKVFETICVNDTANCITPCGNISEPQTPQICSQVEETVEQPLLVLSENIEQIKLCDQPINSPANIPLPLEDDIEMDLILPAEIFTHNNLNVPQNLCTDIQDNTNVKLTLDGSESLEKINNESIIKDMTNSSNANLMPEILSPNILMVMDDTIKHHDDVTHEVIESHIVLELIKVPNVENSSELIHYEREQEIESLKTNQNINEIPVLPDLINQTISLPSLENFEHNKCEIPAIADISLEHEEQMLFHRANPESTNQHTTVHNIPENLPGSVDMELNNDLPYDSESKNYTSLLFLTNYIIEQENESEEAILPVRYKENSIGVKESVNAEEIIKQIATDKGENQLEVITNEMRTDKQDVITGDEILVLENNSSYVSMMGNGEANTETKLYDNIVDIKRSFIEQIAAVPSSPPITSKGYNFSFDDIDDPFTTKIKIRLSPTPATPSIYTDQIANKNMVKIEVPKKEINKNRRRSQPEGKKPTVSRKTFNSTFDGSVEAPGKNLQSNLSLVIKEDVKVNQPTSTTNSTKNFNRVTSNIDNLKKSKASTEILKRCSNILPENAPKELDDVDSHIQVDVISTSSECILEKHIDTNVENNFSESITVTNQSKTMSSSEQSTYCFAGASLNDNIKSKNVFNLPEIDDMNFNPFASKSKMRQSPSPTFEICDPFASTSKTRYSPDSSMLGLPDAECLDSNSRNVDLDEKKQFISSFDKNSEDKTETEPMEKDSSTMNNTTCSSKGMDEKNLTVREVNTEDEDTIEGPFLEPEDHADDKMSNIDSENVDMMEFDDSPAQENAENVEGGELFIDAEAFEFLLNQNKSSVVADSGKESLFLKFDPLFSKRISSDSVLSALNKFQKRQSTPRKADKPPQKTELSPIPGPLTLNVTYEGNSNGTQDSHEDFNVTGFKPTMVVTPAVNPVAAPRNRSMTPTRSNRRSITFTSPAMAVIDRLLSLSANNSSMGSDATTHVSREQNDADIALTQLRELLAEKEIHVYNLRSESKELKDRLATLESQMRILETDSQERLKKINELNNHLIEKTKINKSMAAVVEEYERTIASLIAEIEQDKKRNAEERIKLINERDEQTAHLASMEVSFSDLHSKYEKSKQIILSCKVNEDTYKKSIKEFQESLTKMQSNYELLKQHATSKLNHANQELEKMNKAHEAEVLKLNAMVKRKELHITSLEETLAQKTKANEELAAICDELINKVG